LGNLARAQAKLGNNLSAYDLTAFRGQTVKFSLYEREDAGSVTSFVADDFSFPIEVSDRHE
jgi:hypothetical protein